MRSPTSTARIVTVPANGATTLWNETNSCNRRILARSASTLAAAVSRAAAFSAAGCWETAAALTPARQEAEREAPDDCQRDNGCSDARAFGQRLRCRFSRCFCRGRGLGRVGQEAVCPQACRRLMSDCVLPVRLSLGDLVVF